MGKASSNKKVARAAKAGGGRARAAGERNLLFPSVLAVVLVLGTLLVVYARDDRQSEALASPQMGEHYHSAYGYYVCDEFLADLPEFVAPQNGGIHTHGDGLLHIHPFATSRAGTNATLANFLSDAGAVLGGSGELSDSSFAVPGGDTYTEGDDTCEGLDGDPIVQVAVWESAQAGVDGGEPTIYTSDFGKILLDKEGEAYTIAFAPEGADIPIPPSTSGLEGVGTDLGVPAGEVPDDVGLPGATEDSTTPDESTTTTPDDTTPDDTTPDETTTTEADGGQ